jgi:hypothetical protein
MAQSSLDQMFFAIQNEMFLEIIKARIAKIPEKIMAKNINTH